MIEEDNRNPWQGVSLWREFIYDMRHLGKLHRRATVNLKSLGLNWWILLVIVVGLILFFIPELFLTNPIMEKPGP